MSEGYNEWLSHLKRNIAQAQQRESLLVNSKLIQLYERRDILQRQDVQGLGAKVIERLARNLRDAFPQMRGRSTSNLKCMRYFARHCPNGQFGQQAADQTRQSGRT